jgi:hypothetical protein
MRDCYEWEKQERFYAGLAKIEDAAKSSSGKGFAELSPSQKAELLKSAAQHDREFFLLMKQLTVAGYFTSEIGATKALAYLPIPGRFAGDVPLEPGQKTWAI